MPDSNGASVAHLPDLAQSQKAPLPATAETAPAPAAASAPAKFDSAREVQRYTLKALDLLTRWIEKGEKDPSVPACKWENSTHLRTSREKKSGSSSNGHGARGTEGELAQAPVSEEALFAFLEQTLEDSVNPWTHRFLDKLYTMPTTLSPALELMLGAMNASGVVSSASPALSLAEEKAVEGLARLIGWDVDKVDGLTMPGGSSSNVLAVQTALGNAFPSFKTQGLLGVTEHLMSTGRTLKASRPIILTSEQSHYSIEKAALACGMGLESVQKVKCDADGRINLDHLDGLLAQFEACEESASGIAGFPFFINLTAGTTILGAFDDIRGVTEMIRKWEARRESYNNSSNNSNSSSSSSGARSSHALPVPTKIWIHIDASWGGPVLFSSSLRKLMDGVSSADSLTINPHKVLNITQQCSFAFFQRAADLTVNVTGAKYLFHGVATSGSDQDQREFLRRNPGAKTMGCGRRPDAFKFYIEWLRVSTAGFGAHVERGVGYAHSVVRLVEEKYGETLEVAEATLAGVRAGGLFLQVCFRPRLPQGFAELLAQVFPDEGSALQNGHGKVPYPSPSTSRAHSLLSHSTHTLHAQLRALGRFTVDKAPLAYPYADVGYFIRLVAHPTTSLELYEELVGEVDRLGREYFDEVGKRLGLRGNERDGVAEGERLKEYLEEIASEE
jgi:glutamate decarboxylase